MTFFRNFLRLFRQLYRRSRYKGDERGQTSLFMALFMLTMIMLFAFTTNIGMLVHAKINLQNAADAAAWAGAATQARQLTAVGYLNWEMRRALKEFLFYYTVRGEYSSLPCFPRDSSGMLPTNMCPTNGAIPMCPQDGQSRFNFAFYDCRENVNETGGPYLPSVCIIFDQNNNYCQKAGVPGIPQFQGGGSWGVADPIVQAVQSATDQIIQKKINDCLGRTDINREFLIAWLFNLNPIQGADAILRIGNDSADPFPFSDGLERIGVLPRQAMLRARIDNYEEALNLNLSNEGFDPNITDDTMNQLRNAAVGGGKNLDYFERPIQAFLSAKNNLPGVGADNGNFANIELTELVPNVPATLPTDPGFQNDFIKNPPVLVKFKDEFARITVANSSFELNSPKPGIKFDKGACFQYREDRVIPAFPFGVSKYPGILTYYAVRLQAKARLLFSPFGGNGVVTLSAYSAAKPFGSRVGKDISLDPLHQMVALGLNHEGDSFNTLTTPQFPNVLVADPGSDGPSDTQSGGFTTKAHLGYLVAGMHAFDRLDYGPRLAGAYAPWEVGFYNPPAQFNSPETIGLFEDNPVYQGKYFSMYAPIFPVNSDVGLGFLRQRVAEYLNGGPADAQTLGSKFGDFLGVVMNDSEWGLLYSYLEAQNQIDNLYVPDPTLADLPDLLGYAKAMGQRFTVAAMPNGQRRQLTSWNNQKTSQDQDLAPPGNIPQNSELGPDIGRSGYSVKFISFQSLQGGGQGSNDPEQNGIMWTNPFNRFSSAAGDVKARLQADLQKIQH